MRYLSPLRYPGGKARLAPFLRRLIEAQHPRPTQYAEPFAGGAGAALQLLKEGTVRKIHLNDLNPGIAAFWRAVTDSPGQFCQRIRSTPLDISEWRRQSERYSNFADYDDLDLGFATFFLNRTNRSGILDARPIGGFEQLGRWKIDARFNRENLCTRIEAIASLQEGIVVTQLDGLEFLGGLDMSSRDIFVYADPPYLVQGEGLYLHAFDANAHLSLASTLAKAEYPWILTYDNDPRITSVLYDGGRCATFEIAHTAHRQHVGSEAIIFAPSLKVPDMEITAGRIARWTA